MKGSEMKFSFGTDPEFMLTKNDIVYSAIPIVNGSKDKKKKSGKCAFFYDNVLAECSIPPAYSKEEAVANIGDCLRRYADLVKPYKIEARASHTYDASQLTHPAAREIGCSRECCVYDLEEIEPDEQMFLKTNLRSAGGHVHLGSDVLKEGFNTLSAIRLLDLFLGVASIFIDHDPTSKTRKKLYGQAGRFRTPEYGVEYRSIGNFWLSSPKLVELIYDVCEFVIKFLDEKRIDELWEIDEERLNSAEAWSDKKFHPKQCHKCKGYDVEALRKAVNTMDEKKGLVFLNLIQRYLPNEIFSRIEEFKNNKPFDLYKEWRLD